MTNLSHNDGRQPPTAAANQDANALPLDDWSFAWPQALATLRSLNKPRAIDRNPAVKIADLFQFVGLKHLEGVTDNSIELPAGTKLTVHRVKGRYELRADPPAEPTESHDSKGADRD